MLQNEPYGLLKCNIVETTHIKGKTPHFHIHAIADKVHYRIAINIKSQLYPYEVLYFIDEDYNNTLTKKITEFPFGFSEIGPNIKKEYGIDYIKGNFIDLRKLRPLHHELPGPNNDLDEKIRNITHKALQNPKSILYAYGKRWDNNNKKDCYFDFIPSIGLHDVHMNQECTSLYSTENNYWEDGALFVNFLPENTWSALFFAFQSQFPN